MSEKLTSTKSNKDQGVLIECMQCSIIYPDKDRPDCPECHGKKQYFLQAQMLDKISSQKLVVHDLIELFKNENLFKTELTTEQEKLLKSKCLKLLKDIEVYNFDLKLFLTEKIRKLD